MITQFVEGSDDYQGYSPPLGSSLDGIPSAPRGAPQISTYDIDAKDILEMSAAGNPQASL